jgi:proliferating cell nuclear antigen
MFEARLTQGNLLKKMVDAVKELVTDVNFDVSQAGLTCQVRTGCSRRCRAARSIWDMGRNAACHAATQAMDTSHVCLISMMLQADGFEQFRCDRPRSIGEAKFKRCAVPRRASLRRAAGRALKANACV